MAKKKLSPEEIVKQMEMENPENFTQTENSSSEENVSAVKVDTDEIPFKAEGVYKDVDGKYKMANRTTQEPDYDESSTTKSMMLGYKVIPNDQLPSRGLFYSDGMMIGIKAATVSEIREWSIIDENDPLSISEKLNMIMERCVRVSSPDGRKTWGDISEIDRNFILIRLHELTFPDGENALNIPFKCESCNTVTELPLSSAMCTSLFNPSDKIMRFYNEEKKCFIIESEKLKDPIVLYPPTLGVSNIVAKRVQQMRREGITEDNNMKESMIRCLQFFMPNWRQWTDDKFAKFNSNMLMWSNYKFSVINWFIDEFNKCNTLNAVATCERCGEEVVHPIFFHGGFGLKEFFCISFDPESI